MDGKPAAEPGGPRRRQGHRLSLARLAALLGHEAISVCAMIANRASLDFTEDYKPVVQDLIKFTLEGLMQKD